VSRPNAQAPSRHQNFGLDFDLAVKISVSAGFKVTVLDAVNLLTAKAAEIGLLKTDIA